MGATGSESHGNTRAPRQRNPWAAGREMVGHGRPSPQASLGRDRTLTQRRHMHKTPGLKIIIKKSRKCFRSMEASKTHFEDTVHKVRWFFGNVSPDLLYVVEYIFVWKKQFCAQIRQGRKEKGGDTEHDTTLTTLAHHKNVNYTRQQTDCNFQHKNSLNIWTLSMPAKSFCFATEQWH